MLAILYDVHGNLPALEAVLADARERGGELRGHLLGGDFALFGGWPVETVARLRELSGATWIRGNGERWTAAPADAPEPVRPACEACAEALGDALVEELAALPFEHHEGDDLRFVHASTHSDVRSFLPEPAGDEAELLEGVGTGTLVFGHTHLPFERRTAGGVRLVNPGSVGMPFDGDPRAAYALLHDDGTVEHRRVAYAHEASAERVVERFGEAAWTRLVRGRIARARFDP